MKYKKLKLVIFCCLLQSYALAQGLNVVFGSFHFNIPSFRQTGWNSLDNQFAVKAKILKPITESGDDIEIRVYHYGFGVGQAAVISFNKDSITAFKYLWYPQRPSNGKFPSNPLKTKYMVIRTRLNLKKNMTWASFLDELFKNRFCEIPGQDGMNIEVLQNNPKTTIIPADGGGETVYEIKVKDRFRQISYYNEYDPEPTQIEDSLRLHCNSHNLI